MHQFRLIGLVLFITTAFLTMASAVTQTTHIRFKRPTRLANGDLVGERPVNPQLNRQLNPQLNRQQAALEQPVILPPALEPSRSTSSQSVNEPASTNLQFISVPVIYPLLIAGTLGLLMWFVPASLSRPTPTKRKRRRW